MITNSILSQSERINYDDDDDDAEIDNVAGIVEMQYHHARIVIQMIQNSHRMCHIEAYMF